MTMLSTGTPVSPKSLLAVKPPIDPETIARLKRAQTHAALCHLGGRVTK